METSYGEMIIKKVKEAQNQQTDLYQIENDINNGFIIVKYEKMAIDEKELLDGAITMQLPAEFAIMDREQAENKYPGPDKPDYIYTNEDTTVNLTFSLVNVGEITNAEISEAAKLMARQMKRLYPAVTIANIQTIPAAEKEISYFSFDLPVIDGDLFNLMFFMEHQNQLLMGTFNCSIYQKKQWQPIIRQMLATIKTARQTSAEKPESR
ncbi:MAG: hypothetical protein FWC60_07965 [Firmicutes bacterium]|nr:hypothetical protein [Bacillota bacterium]